MSRMTRRRFLHTSVAAAAAFSTVPHIAKAKDPNGKLGVAIVGVRGRGGDHIGGFLGDPRTVILYLVDADEKVGRDRCEQVGKKQGVKPKFVRDMREAFQDPAVDLVGSATPNHWHALSAIWAMQAGKDVYVEKPLSHNLFEGRQTVAAATKYRRIVQWGNQNHGHRTGPIHLEREKLGKIRVVWTSLNRMRQSIGKVAGPQTPPAGLDYDLWTGPAPLLPLTRRNLHYDWHWVWPTGTGEMGNNGIYSLDAARLQLGLNTLPRRVMSLGGRFLFDDDGETPNTQIALFQYEPGTLVIFELRNLPSEKGPKTSGTKVRYEQGDAGLPGAVGTEGDRGGFSAHKGHLFNFLSAVRSRAAGGLEKSLEEEIRSLRMDPARFESRSRNTPFGGFILKGWPAMTIVGGRVAWKDVR